MTSAVRVREIAGRADRRRFLDVAWHCNAHDPNWVPPLRITLRTLLDRNKHPFHEHADVAFFLAERNGEAVGRIAAVVNGRYNELHGERTGFFGLFESENDTAVSGALLDAAANWLRARGMERILGPMNLSTNDEAASPGTLIEGFDVPPLVMMSHNPPFYERLIGEAGLVKAKDLLAYRLTGPNPPERVVRGVNRLLRRSDIRIRSIDLKRFKEELATVFDIYNSAWARNWGFVPMTEREFEFVAKEFRPIVDPELALIAEAGGEPVGFYLALPDLNAALRKLPNGRLFPFGLVRLLWERRKIRGMRVITLGLKPGYQHQGLGAALSLRAWQAGAAKGYTYGEASWILEDNSEMRHSLENTGARLYKRYRVFEAPL